MKKLIFMGILGLFILGSCNSKSGGNHEGHDHGTEAHDHEHEAHDHEHEGHDHEHEGEVALDVYSVNSKKYWLSVWNYESAIDTWYVGVTSNKSYTLKLSTDSETGAESGSVTISYSQSINNQTPKVTDY